ncbi:hypothetical protein L198_08110 [Cryptococcus wingfieldii CBS 7118]|uniref:Transferase n=1 Tax=Cryptococcus wingfieldii CBS 7118 TaxID=1295528 RepID=A0A1E3HJ19_9TREE|nr:hypothetical protein L198_08110 [Cryptococcus wingfieldii CBS 7118]ODN76334.1 hypothetical protein L198_08110 [Cryptococcus wingfieldii CBS 7118]
MSRPATGSSADLKTILIPCAPISTPHVPSGTTEIPLGDNSLTAYLTVSSVLAFDGALDESKLVKAISLLSGAWPTLAGRFKSVGEGADTKFSIELTSSPIPFETQTIERDQAFPDKLVIQPTIKPYMPPLNPNVRFPNTDNHLFSVRLTTLLPSNKSVLGVQVSHLGMDGTMARHLVKLLDALYTHGEAALQSTDSEIVIPTFFPGGVGPLHAYDASTDNLAFAVSWKAFPEAIRCYIADFKTSSRVALQFTKPELQALRDQYQLDSELKLSTQDAISAWWATLLNKVGVDVKSIVYFLDYRKWCIGHPSFPPNLPTLAAGVSQVSPIDISAASTPGQVAETIRKHISTLRASEKDEALHWLSNASRYMHESTVNDQAVVFGGDEQFQAVVFGGDEQFMADHKSVIVNSNIRIDWSFSFGFKKHQVSYHSEFTCSHFLRVYQANLDEGEEKGDKIELYFHVPKGQAEKAKEIIQSDREQWAVVSGASV